MMTTENIKEELTDNGILGSTVLGTYKTAVSGGEEKQSMYAQFNKTSGVPVALISVVPLEYLNTEDFVYVECEGSPFTDRIVGTVEDFQILPQDEETITVYEKSLNELAIDRIIKDYPVIEQINVIKSVVMKICEVLGNDEILASNEFSALFEMDEYIKEVLLTNKTKKEYYAEAEGFEYVSIEQQERDFDSTLEGGVRDKFGPRPVGSTSRIF